MKCESNLEFSDFNIKSILQLIKIIIDISMIFNFKTTKQYNVFDGSGPKACSKKNKWWS